VCHFHWFLWAASFDRNICNATWKTIYVVGGNFFHHHSILPAASRKKITWLCSYPCDVKQCVFAFHISITVKYTAIEQHAFTSITYIYLLHTIIYELVDVIHVLHYTISVAMLGVYEHRMPKENMEGAVSPWEVINWHYV